MSSEFEESYFISYAEVTVFACIARGQSRFLSGFLESWLARANLARANFFPEFSGTNGLLF